MLDVNEKKKRRLYQIIFEKNFLSLQNQLSHQLARLSQG
jgi:hypothetical protein